MATPRTDPKGPRRHGTRTAGRRTGPPATPPPDWDALALAAQSRAESAPVPVSYKNEWFPAMVKVPDLPAPIRVAKVYATSSGLYVYTRRPRQGHTLTGGTPHWWARVDYDKTPRPATGYAARDAGIHLVTEAGVVVVQPLGGCGCQHGSLKAWRPDWANRNEAWEATA